MRFESCSDIIPAHVLKLEVMLCRNNVHECYPLVMIKYRRVFHMHVHLLNADVGAVKGT